jgi:hypothetical protein
MESRSLLEFLIQCIVIISTATGGTWWLFEKAELVLAADRQRLLSVSRILLLGIRFKAGLSRLSQFSTPSSGAL